MTLRTRPNPWSLSLIAALGIALPGVVLGADRPSAGTFTRALAHAAAPPQRDIAFQLDYGGGQRIDALVTQVERTHNPGPAAVTARIETDWPARYQLFASQNEMGEIRVSISDTEGFVHRIALGNDGFSFHYEEGNTVHSFEWKRPGGGLLETLDRQPELQPSGELAYPFNRAPLHRLTIQSLKAIDFEGATGISIQRLQAATEMLAKWLRADAPPADRSEWQSLQLQKVPEAARAVYHASLARGREDRRSINSAPLEVVVPNHSIAIDDCAKRVATEIREGAPEISGLALQDRIEIRVEKECGCIIPRSGAAQIGSAKLSVLGATASIEVADVKVQALCAPGSTLASEAAGGVIESLSASPGDCPPGADPVGDPEVVAVAFRYSGHAKVFPKNDCCHNGPTDTAISSKAQIGFGNEQATISGPSASGDWIRGESTLEAAGRVCYEADLIFDDLLDIVIGGTATASGS